MMIYEASFTGLVRTIIIIVLAILVIRLISRIVLPWLIKILGKKMSEKAADHMRNRYEQHRDARGRVIKDDGNVRVEYLDKKKGSKNHDDDDGEYVDYEEVDDK